MIDPNDIMIGIAAKNIDMIGQPIANKDKAYWGYICCVGKKFSSTDELPMNYGELCGKNDFIGVLLEFSDTHAQLTFYRNKKNLGVAYSDIPLGIYCPAATMYYTGVQISLITNVFAPVEKKLS